MAISKTEVSASLRPDIPDWVDPESREEILEEVGRYVATEIALVVGDGISPVEGHGAFKKLSSDYADDEKGGDRTPNLELEGDMMKALDWRVEMNEVKVGFFEKGQAIKAYGHNTGMKGHKWLDGKAPVRRLIPDKNESFNKDIQEGIDQIVESYVSALEEDEQEDQEEAVASGESRSLFSSMIDWLSGGGDDEGWF